MGLGQPVQDLAQVWRQGGGALDEGTRPGLAKAQLGCVEELAAQKRRSPPVDRVADDRMAYGGEVDPYLVGPPGDGGSLDQGMAL